jgi:4-amino-4-deoxy-L-arabinose transferase-like glycosyltransferase
MISIIKNSSALYSLTVGFSLFFIVALTKNSLGPDEETYLRVGTIFLDSGLYTFTKAHPLLSIVSAALNKIFHNPLLTYQIIYGMSGMILSFSIYKILEEVLKDQVDIKFSHIFALLTPGVILLCLYAISNIFFTSIAYLSIYFFYLTIIKNSSFYSLISGLLVGLSYLARMDGIVLFFGLCLTLLILGFLSKTSYLKVLLIFVLVFLLTILPWQMYLSSNDMILSSVIRGGYASGYWTDGIAKYILGDGTRIDSSELNFLNHFFIPTAKNIVIYSENISSMKSFPFFLWAFVLFGFYEINFKKEYIVFAVPFFTTFSYLIFFVETRYLVSAVPLLGIMASLGYINLINRNNLNKNKYLFLILFIIYVMDVSFMVMWLN